jgi:hypothetical protein
MLPVPVFSVVITGASCNNSVNDMLMISLLSISKSRD